MMRLVPCLAGLIVLAFSCTGGASAGREEFLAGYCELLRPCCQQAHLPDDLADCRARLELKVPRAGFDPQAAGACLTALREGAQRADFCQRPDPDQRACDGMFAFARSVTGSKPPGEPCLYSGECAASDEGPVVCQTEFAASSRRARARACQIQIRGRQGDGPCELTLPDPEATFPYPNLYSLGLVTYRRSTFQRPALPPARKYHCYRGDGLRCAEEEQRCVPLARVGERCTSSVDCAAGAFCDPSGGVCRARQPMGAACNPDGFAQQVCQAGGYCDASTRTCSSQVAFGAPCTQDDQCTTGACVNDRCAASDFADLGAELVCGGR
jgi:hypothetical protein